ncbi:hypothetical protein GCK32_008340 [Trichostrongylus colubriformis]|uniref:Cytoplasmic polyadenylation element-binding protein 1 n=1 Tax=Trichostrongylus colubriformis TaxID=6319 RepID=A0AAN8J2X7_TRICO
MIWRKILITGYRNENHDTVNIPLLKKKMSKRGFLNLNDDNFWGNEDSKAEVNSEKEESSENKYVNHPDKEDDVERADDDAQSEECRHNGKSDWDGWESVRADIMKKSDGKLDIGHPFRYNSPFGGFSRTNAALYYQDEQQNGQLSERTAARKQQESSQIIRHRASTFMENGQMETQAELLSRRDFSTLDALNAVYRDKYSFAPSTQRERWTTKRTEDDGEDREAWEKERLSSSGSGSSVAEQSGDGPRGGWTNSERTDLNMIDEQYVEYYEYLCQGIQRLFESGITFNVDCESRVELAHIMDRLYGSVACAGIDTDVEYKYPKGAGRVAFTNYNSYMRAITERYAQLSHGEVEKRVEMKPYVLDDQICEECIREPNGGRHAPFFCPHLECLQYYCESCWTSMHGSPSREHHKPLVKEA